ncbi:hypothetical protein, partial [Candidatus Aalborgicola defluviihabitans]|uniref:hypothetical protein n=1 Tax=Candidatus Aalborgicola defluviihabitans TaxID=3386187 RepID=UPI0039B8CB2D
VGRCCEALEDYPSTPSRFQLSATRGITGMGLPSTQSFVALYQSGRCQQNQFSRRQNQPDE